MADINLGVGGANSATGGYEIDNSLKFEPDNSEMLYTNSLTAGNRRTWTISMWVKRTELSYESAFMYSQGTYGNIRFFTDDKIVIENGGLYLITNRVFRDTSAWYHVVWVNDSTQSTASNRSKLYINGVQETSFSTETYMSQNQEGNVNSTSGIYIGRRSSEVKHFAGYIADVYKIDGQALAPTDFGEFDEDTGIWIPKEYTGGSYSTQGFHLDFSDSSDLGNDSSGENNDFLLQNITAADQATDTPTNNFCTWNVNYNYTNSNGNPTITEGATKTAESSGGWTQAKATMGVTSGKWYWEYKMGGSISWMGVQDDTASQTELAGQYTLFLYNGDNTVEINDTGSLRDDTVLSYTFSTSNIYAVALNMDDNEISYYQNGSIIGSAISLDGLADRLLLPYIGTNSSTNETNFGGYTTISISSAASDANGYGTFEYAPPSGYYALCTKNLAEYG
jgi:hypothetical protein